MIIEKVNIKIIRKEVGVGVGVQRRGVDVIGVEIEKRKEMIVMINKDRNK